MTNVLRFPEPSRAAVSGGAGLWRRVCDRLRIALGRLLPLVVREVDVTDAATGQHLVVSAGPFFTRISVNGRDYYFSRITGRFDGTGSAS